MIRIQVILAGGFGTRLSEETADMPKPMVNIGEKPILWHIMKFYSSHGFDEFIILLGYKGYVIKEFFANYFLHQSNVTINLADNSMEVHQNNTESWKVTLLETGLNTLTGGRIKRAKDFIGNDDFLLTYGDGLSNVDIGKTVEFHKSHNKIVTMTTVKPAGRFGIINVEADSSISSFKEKPKDEQAWINGGFFVCKSEVLNYIDGDSTIFEQEPLTNLAINDELMSFKHYGFWQCMDTLRDKESLRKMWDSNSPPWKRW